MKHFKWIFTGVLACLLIFAGCKTSGTTDTTDSTDSSSTDTSSTKTKDKGSSTDSGSSTGTGTGSDTGSGSGTSLESYTIWDIKGETYAHDPTMIYDGSTYHVFYTGDYIIHKTSTDGRTWASAGTVFSATNMPSWITTSMSDHNGADIWAPDIYKIGDTYYLYYTLSIFGTNNSTIGLATSTDLTTWTDKGKVISSASGSESYNCIDPNLVIDNDGKYWLSFGSCFSGIYIVEIDSSTMMLKESSTPVCIADNGFASDSTQPVQEAPYIWNPGNGYYYLITSVGACCSGVNSTYTTRYGRSESITGPYVDEDDVSMLESGGTILMDTTIEAEPNVIGPGGECIAKDANGNYVLVYHYYDKYNAGAATLAIRGITTDSDNWIKIATTSENTSTDVSWTTEDDSVSASGLVEKTLIPAFSVDPVNGFDVEFTCNLPVKTGDWTTFVLSYLGYNVTVPNLDPCNNIDDTDSTLDGKNAYPTCEGATLSTGYNYNSAFTGTDKKIKINFDTDTGIKYYIDGTLAYWYTTSLWDGAITTFIERLAEGISSGMCSFNVNKFTMKDVTITRNTVSLPYTINNSITTSRIVGALGSNISSDTGLSVSFKLTLGSTATDSTYEWDELVKVAEDSTTDFIRLNCGPIGVVTSSGWCNIFESAATKGSEFTADNWTIFCQDGSEQYVTISLNTDGTVVYYKNGVPALTYAADYKNEISDSSGTIQKSISEIVAYVLETVPEKGLTLHATTTNTYTMADVIIDVAKTAEQASVLYTANKSE